jgi:hypothetical protein
MAGKKADQGKGANTDEDKGNGKRKGGGGTYPAHADPAAAEEVDVLLLDEELHHGGTEAGVREHADLLRDVAGTQGPVSLVAKIAKLHEKFFLNAQEYYYWKFKDKIFLLLNLHHI